MAMEAKLTGNGHATEARASLMDEVLAETERHKRELEPRSMDEAWRLAAITAKSGLNGITSTEIAHVLIQAGRELGLSAMQSLRALYIEKGKVCMFADTMVALIRRSGKCAQWDIVETTATKCTIEAQRVDGKKPLTITWTIEEARNIFMDAKRTERLTDKQTWQNYPRMMLRHRCDSEMARALFSDVTLGLYTPEELEGIPAEDVMRAAKQPDAPKWSEEHKAAFVPADERLIMDYAARCDKAQTEADLATLAAEAKAQIPAVRKAFQPLYSAAKARIKPNGEGPKSGGGAPKPEAAQSTDATGGTADTATATADVVLTAWVRHLAEIKEPQHVLASIAAHLHEVPEGLRAQCLEAGARRLRGFRAFEGQDANQLIADAIQRREAKAA